MDLLPPAVSHYPICVANIYDNNRINRNLFKFGTCDVTEVKRYKNNNKHEHERS